LSQVNARPPTQTFWVGGFLLVPFITLDYIFFTNRKFPAYITGISFKAYQTQWDQKMGIPGGMK